MKDNTEARSTGAKIIEEVNSGEYQHVLSTEHISESLINLIRCKEAYIEQGLDYKWIDNIIKELEGMVSEKQEQK